MDEENDDLGDGALGAASLIEHMKKEFAGKDRPATAEELARLYGVMLAQHETLLAVYALAMKANPKLIFSDQAVEAQKALSVSVEAMVDAVKDLARDTLE